MGADRMKRSQLRRRTPLRVRRRPRILEPGRAAWKEPTRGYCTVCMRPGWIVKHHVCYEQHVRREGGDPWALANSMLLGRDCACHAQHHSGFKRIPFDLVPDEAVDFARRLLGDDRAALYFARFYAPARVTGNRETG